ncbi:MAG: hypothetical protein K2X54_03165 [Methylobacterium organophilum]|nr:hypothetical protein [Methylobacterium organophilum]
MQVLGRGLERLGAVVGPLDDENTPAWMPEWTGDEAAESDRSAWLRLMGLDPDERWPVEAADAPRAYVVAQYRAIQAKAWASPGQAIVYAAAQAAAHSTLSTAQGQPEPEVSIDLMKEFVIAVRDTFIPAMEGEGAHLPEGHFLDVAMGSTNNQKDRLGADFAVVTGVIVDDVVKYRVVLFQAKWEDTKQRNKADVWHDGGNQLSELLATGLGYYLFFPRRYWEAGKERPVFLPTVRSAENVGRDAHAITGDTVRKVDTCVGSQAGDVAWDFAGFLGLTLASLQDDGIGAVFDTPAEVADLLSQKRKRPLVHSVFAYDLSPGRSLNLSDLAEALETEGYDVEVFGAPSWVDALRDEDRDDRHETEGFDTGAPRFP